MEIRNSLKELCTSILLSSGNYNLGNFHQSPMSERHFRYCIFPLLPTYFDVYQLMKSLSFQKIEDKSSDISDESEEISKYLTIHWRLNSRFQNEVNIKILSWTLNNDSASTLQGSVYNGQLRLTSTSLYTLRLFASRLVATQLQYNRDAVAIPLLLF